MASFLDTSALAKVYHQEVGSAFMEQLLLRPDQTDFVSRLGVLEMHSVLAGKVRINEITPGRRGDNASPISKRGEKETVPCHRTEGETLRSS